MPIYVHLTECGSVLLDKTRISRSQEIPRIFWTLNVHYSVHNSLTLTHNLTQINPVYISTHVQ